MPDHLTELLSAHLDGALSPAEEMRIRAHLDTCPGCSGALRELEAAVAAVRALPAERMPVPVRLPQTPPVAVIPPPPPAMSVMRRPWAIATGSFVAVAAAVLVTLSLAHAPQPSPSALRAPGRGSAAAPAVPSPAGLMPQAQSACGATVIASGSAVPPSPFGTQVTARSESVPGEQLVLATTSGRVSPGQQILVFARESGTSGLSVPCVTAVRPQAPPAAAAQGQGGALTNTAPETIALAQPTSDVSVAAVPLQVLTVPADLQPGTQIVLTATVAAPGVGTPLTVQLPLTVD